MPADVEVTDDFDVTATQKGKPGTLTWLVDTVRAEVGPEAIGWLEQRVFALKDAAERGYHGIFGSDATNQAIASDLGLSKKEQRTRVILNDSEVDISFPPPDVPAIIAPAVEGEGQWRSVEGPFVKRYPNAPANFAQTFLRVDEERLFARIYLVAWDPRQTQLRIQSGTREPESATGETATGTVPRKKEVLERLIAGFNGGFQSLHGEFGMIADRKVYLPPKPWAATVTVDRDGTVAMGSWFDPPDKARAYEERWALKQVPETVVDLRQNLTSVVEGKKYNPWQRWWWGAAPSNDDEQVFIDRSGLCLSDNEHLIYFWGKSMGADQLGTAMLQAGCIRGIHLDMNQRHTAFEFHNITARETFEAPQTLPENHFDTKLPTLEGYYSRGKLLATTMTPMRLPRYIYREPRDFFYLLQKPILPGPDLAPGDQKQSDHKLVGGAFSVKGLPNVRWPYAFAKTSLAVDKALANSGSRLLVLRIDSHQLLLSKTAGDTDVAIVDGGRQVPTGEFAPDAKPGHDAPVAVIRSAGSHGLCKQALDVGYRWHIDSDPQARAECLAHGDLLSADAPADAALAIDRDGFIVYLERQSEAAPTVAEALKVVGADPRSTLLLRMGKGAFHFVNAERRVGIDGYEISAAGLDAALVEVSLFHDQRTVTQILNPDVKPRPYWEWRRMQDTRVRYFRDPDKGYRFSSKDKKEAQ